MEEEITESQGPFLSLHHPGALIVDAVATVALTPPHVRPDVFAGGGDNGTTCEGCRLEITSSQQWDGPPVVEPACQNRRGPRFRLLESDGTMRSRFWAAPSSARGEICTRACLCARLAAAQTSITINIHGDMWKILKRIKQQRPRRTHQTTFFLAPTDGELRLSRGGETSHGRPRFPTTHESGIVCLLGA